MKQNDLRFHVIRVVPEVIQNSYIIDGKHCPKCRKLTVKGSDVTRRYCSNYSCNALIID